MFYKRMHLLVKRILILGMYLLLFYIFLPAAAFTVINCSNVQFSHVVLLDIFP